MLDVEVLGFTLVWEVIPNAIEQRAAVRFLVRADRTLKRERRLAPASFQNFAVQDNHVAITDVDAMEAPARSKTGLAAGGGKQLGQVLRQRSVADRSPRMVENRRAELVQVRHCQPQHQPSWVPRAAPRCVAADCD